MQKFIKYVLALGILALTANCSTPADPTQKPPGFLPNYSLLKQVKTSDDDMKMYAYIAPGVKRSDYNAVLVESVTLYQTATESGVTSEEIEKARAGIDKGIHEIVSKKAKITDQPGPKVIRLQVMITGATVERDSLKPWNILPVSLAITLASKATNLDGKTPAMVVELKLTDSQSGKLVKEIVTTITGDKFRMKSNTAEEFENMATTWVQQALKYANKSSD